jgi:hypothetical protein
LASAGSLSGTSRPIGFEIQDQKESCGLLDRQILWLCALENLVDKSRSTPTEISEAFTSSFATCNNGRAFAP